jgi:hypothetical protein
VPERRQQRPRILADSWQEASPCTVPSSTRAALELAALLLQSLYRRQ